MDFCWVQAVTFPRTLISPCAFWRERPEAPGRTRSRCAPPELSCSWRIPRGPGTHRVSIFPKYPMRPVAYSFPRQNLLTRNRT